MAFVIFLEVFLSENNIFYFISHQVNSSMVIQNIYGLPTSILIQLTRYYKYSFNFQKLNHGENTDFKATPQVYVERLLFKLYFI